MQANQDDWEAELLDLAEATDQLADAVTDQSIAARLRMMADELRSMLGHGSSLEGACCLPA
ncbi:MAG TPA: hypothetical protein VFL55_23015 [Acetobacteraceae bacterium]|nr:hypothetical protein [Acetobacteraceae bacterium]